MPRLKSSWEAMNANIGELAALGTAVCFSASSIFFSQAGKRYGPLVSNRLRLVVAILLLGITHWIVFGKPIPVDASLSRWLWLGSSGIVGLAIGDLFLFQAYVLLGARLGLLFLSLAPALAAVLAWLFLGERLDAGSIVGITVTLAGIAWVVLESNPGKKPPADQEPGSHSQGYSRGILAGLLAAAGQAIGVVLAKNGLGGNFPALSGNVIRMTAAFIALWGVTVIQRQVIATIRQANNSRSGMYFVLGGSILGPLIGVSLSLFSIQHTNVGIASTIIALPPVFLLPVGHFVFKERISRRAVAGTLLAIAGVTLLFWL
jgi:drug/metabolite transporter (DMT)-like permease